MAKLKFISGYLSEDDEWVIKSDCLRAGQLHYREIPYGEIIALEKKEGAGKLVFAELTLSNDKVVTAKLKENAYAKLYELFLQYGNKSTHPVKFPKERLSKSGVLAVIFSGFVVFSCVANSNNTSSSSGGLVTKSSDGIVSYSKKELCQGGISTLFGASPKSMEIVESEGNYVYVRYSQDNEIYTWACSFNYDSYFKYYKVARNGVDMGPVSKSRVYSDVSENGALKIKAMIPDLEASITSKTFLKSSF